MRRVGYTASANFIAFSPSYTCQFYQCFGYKHLGKIAGDFPVGAVCSTSRGVVCGQPQAIELHRLRIFVRPRLGTKAREGGDAAYGFCSRLLQLLSRHTRLQRHPQRKSDGF